VRIHPAIIAQAAATTAALMPGRFFLGVGTGENLNEHVVGQGWPETEIRQERLAEAIEVIRQLWRGGNQSHHGPHFTVENARLYSLPDELPPLLIAAGGPQSAALAGRLGDGMIGTGPEAELFAKFDEAGGTGKPRYGELTVCWAKDEKTARRTAREHWPTAAMESSLSWELPLPAHFEAVAELVTEDQVAESVTCGPDPSAHVKAIAKYAEAGYDHICVHQVGKIRRAFSSSTGRRFCRISTRSSARLARDVHESALLAWHGRRPGRYRARPDNPRPARHHREDHGHGHLWLRPPPLRRLHADNDGCSAPVG
jgi:G6PDH family F420-dependent oxidoreductase